MAQLLEFVMNHWLLWSALFVVLALIFINERLEQKNKVHELTPSDVVDKINHDDAIVVDIRDKDLYKKGHIVDALSMSKDLINQGKLDNRKDKTIILVCGSGAMASLLAIELKTKGFLHIYSLKGGMGAWVEAQLPVVKA